MQRLIARFLLLFAAAGVVLPPALQATAAPNHLCCRRSAQHHCHSFAATNPGEAAFHASGCSQNCRRAVVISHWGHPEPLRTALYKQAVAIAAPALPVRIADEPLRSALSARAPPRYSAN